MNSTLKEEGSMEREVTVTLTQRDILLMQLCLHMMARDHAKNGTTCFDVERLRERLVDVSRQNG